jgi:hypothetical protein
MGDVPFMVLWSGIIRAMSSNSLLMAVPFLALPA